MDCYKFNEPTQNKIEHVMEGIETEKSCPEATYYKSIYSPATLINDWFEKRTKPKGESPSEPDVSENMDKYRPPCKTTVPDRRDMFTKIFESNGLGQQLLIDHQGLAYYDNYATTYDLMFNHLTKGICGPYPRRYYKGRYKPEVDLTKIYGNVTQWGLKEFVYEKYKTILQPAVCLPVSETSSEYVAYDANEIKKLNDFPKFKKIKVDY